MIVEIRSAGGTHKQIAKAIGMSATTVYRYLAYKPKAYRMK